MIWIMANVCKFQRNLFITRWIVPLKQIFWNRKNPHEISYNILLNKKLKKVVEKSQKRFEINQVKNYLIVDYVTAGQSLRSEAKPSDVIARGNHLLANVVTYIILILYHPENKQLKWKW